ncbi:MAG: DUF4177 domain-containing protein [Armatimonadetes bacterium]|jgi:hypothetical protein|nr:DUF4177 domain-containing protein [Armatimonadota bacterium]
MQRWEYKIVYRSEHVGGWVVDGKPAPELGKREDPEVLNQFGQEGWELVAVVAYTYFFKRPLA